MTDTLIKVAAAQILVEGGAPAANLRRAVAAIATAAHSGCQLVVLPECLDLGWTHPSARGDAEPIPGPRCEQLSRAAADHRVLVAAGLTERDGSRIYNAAVLLGPAGELLLKYRKINELEIAHDLYAIGDRLAVAHTALGTIGLNICADNFPNALDIGRTLGRMGAQLLVSPSAWAVDADHDNQAQPYGNLWRDAYATLARQFQMPVVGVSSVGPLDAGPWTGRKCIGCSLVIDKQGREVMMGPYGEPAVLGAELTISSGTAQGTAISGML
jgi:predicted amidohydrolase